MLIFNFTTEQQARFNHLKAKCYELNLHFFDEKDGMDRKSRKEALAEVTDEIQVLKILCKIT